MKLIIVGALIFINLLFAHSYPYCSYETASFSQTVSLQNLLNDETDKILQKLQKIETLQQNLIKVLNQKIILLQQIKAIAAKNLISKQKQNFELNQIIKLMELNNENK